MGNTQGRSKTFGLFLSGVTAFLGTGGLCVRPALAQCNPGGSGPDAVSLFNSIDTPFEEHVP